MIPLKHNHLAHKSHQQGPSWAHFYLLDIHILQNVSEDIFIKLAIPKMVLATLCKASASS